MSEKSIRSRDSSTKALSDILGGIFAPENLPGMGFKRGFVLTIVEPYICKLMSNPAASELVTGVRFQSDHHLIILVENEIFRHELGWQKEHLRQKINARMKCEMLRKISIYSGKDKRSGIRYDKHG